MNNTDWKPVLEYENLYEVSKYGIIRNYKTKKILNPSKTHDGYLQVILYKAGKRKNCLVHRVTWEAFNGPIPKELQVNHITENKEQNQIWNLELVTPKENINYGTSLSRRTKALCKPVLQFDKQGNLINEFPSLIATVEALNISSPGNIGNCIKGNRKSAYGFIWKYKDV